MLGDCVVDVVIKGELSILEYGASVAYLSYQSHRVRNDYSTGSFKPSSQYQIAFLSEASVPNRGDLVDQICIEWNGH
jgi:hypothetical protein